MPSKKTFRFSHEEAIYLELLKNRNFKKASEETLSTISLKHSHEAIFSLATDGFELTENNSPKLYEAFLSAKSLLKISPKTRISLYISNNQQINAGCIFLNKNHYAVYLNSGIINLMNLEELKFVIGHEIGHLKYQHHKIIKEPDQRTSPSTQIRLFEHSRYAEISADRCGLFVSDSLDVCKSALLKLSTGTNLSLLDLSANNSIVEIENIKEHLETDNGLINEKLSHPYSQMRLYALERFNEYMIDLKSKSARSSKQKNELLLKNIDNDIAKVLSLLNPKIDKLKSLALIYGSFWVSYSHDKNTRVELERIEGICDPIYLSQAITDSKNEKNKSKYFKEEFISIIKSKKCNFSLSEKSDLLDKISLVATADSDLHMNEKKVLYSVADLLGMPKSYVHTMIKKALR
jgi:uncharacterized tellurite resistance protein B-like protein